MRKTRSEYHLNQKLHVILKYGGKCVYCGCEELAILTIDHKNNDGKKDRGKKCSRQFYYDLRVGEIRDDLQVMCMSCNTRKRIYGNDLSQWESKKVMTSQVTPRPFRIYKLQSVESE